VVVGASRAGVHGVEAAKHVAHACGALSRGLGTAWTGDGGSAG
jgi:hypothetical protein